MENKHIQNYQKRVFLEIKIIFKVQISQFFLWNHFSEIDLCSQFHLQTLIHLLSLNRRCIHLTDNKKVISFPEDFRSKILIFYALPFVIFPGKMD